MAVEFITYQKKKLPVKVDYYVLLMLQKMHGVSLAAIDQGDLEVYQPILFYALERGHKVKGMEFPFKMEDMVDVLGECFFEFVALMPKFFPADLVEKLMGGGGQTKGQ